MLFDLEADPQEYYDLGASSEHGAILDLMYQRLGEWARRPSQRTTKSEHEILNMRGKSRGTGVLLGVYDGSEVDPDLLTSYSGKAQRHIQDPSLEE